MRRALVLVAILLAALGVAGGVPAAARADNAAIAVNTKDGADIFKFAFKIRRVAGDVVDETNAAVAFSSCNSCSTTAIAIQIVLITGSPSTVTPTNLALAVNVNCNLCNTFAAAYQFVITREGPVRFTSDGMRELAAIRKEIRELEKLDLSPFELAERLKPLIARLKVVLQTQLVSGTPVEREDDDEDRSNEGEEVPEAPGATTNASTEPEATATVSPTTEQTSTETEPTETGVTTTTP